MGCLANQPPRLLVCRAAAGGRLWGFGRLCGVSIHCLLVTGHHLPCPTPPISRCRRSHKELRRTSWIHDGDVEWHGVTPNTPDWSETSRFLAYSLKKPGGGGLYIAFNASHQAQVGRAGVGAAMRTCMSACVGCALL